MAVGGAQEEMVQGGAAGTSPSSPPVGALQSGSMALLQLPLHRPCRGGLHPRASLPPLP
jgi:hypothetical protein